MIVCALALLLVAPVVWAETWERRSPRGAVRDIGANERLSQSQSRSAHRAHILVESVSHLGCIARHRR